MVRSINPMIFECRMKKILFFLFTCALTIGSVQAQEAADSIKIYYRRGYRNVDPSFRDNRSQLEYFLNSIGATLKNDRVEKIVIRSYASPDGAVQANEQLAARRAEELKAYLVREGNVPPHLIEHHAEGVAWNMLREQVVASDMAGRNEVLDILDHTPLWIYDDKGHIVDGRKKQLMDLQKGKPYNYMLEHFFPDLRNSVNITLYLHVVEKNCEKQAEAAPSYKAENTESLQTILAKAPADKEIAPPATSTPTTVDVKPVRNRPGQAQPATAVLPANRSELYKQRIRSQRIRRQSYHDELHTDPCGYRLHRRVRKTLCIYTVRRIILRSRYRRET